MTCKVEKAFLRPRDINEIKNDLFVEGAPNDYGPSDTLRAYGETQSSLYIPFAYAKTRFKQAPNKDTEFPATNYDFRFKQYPFRTDGGRDQKQVYEEAKALIRKHKSVMLSLPCGYGKTMLGILLGYTSKLKCAVLVHRGVLTDQWIESITKFTSAKPQIVDTDGVLDPTADFYIFNIAYVHKRWDREKQGWSAKKLGIYKDVIGTLIVDEAHIACASEMSKALLYFNPRVMIALTATPHRKDGMDKALELYFGAYRHTRIVRIAQNPFTVYRLPTGVKPQFTRNAFGKKDWNSVITSLIENEQRNQIIIDLIRKFHSHIILVLTKRKSHCQILSERLSNLKITNAVMVGTAKKYDKTARVLLSTYSKLGVGFDDPRLNMLIVACSVTEVEQYAGRLRDAEGKKRVIIDLVDDDHNCKSHWSDRRKWYISRNGTVKHYYKDFPEEKEGIFKSPNPRTNPHTDSRTDLRADSRADADDSDSDSNPPPKRLARPLHLIQN